MRTRLRRSVLSTATLLIAATALSMPRARGETGEENPRASMEELERITGLTSNMISVAYEHLGEVETMFERSKDRFEKFGKAVNYLRLYEKALNGEGYFDIARTALWDQLQERLEGEAAEFLGPNFAVWLKVFRAYKVALELLNDFYVKPAARLRIYTRYRDYREDGFDTFMAFTQATARDYYTLKQDAYRELIESKGMNANRIGEKGESKLADKLWDDIDRHWREAVEAEYQAEKQWTSMRAALRADPDALAREIRTRFRNEVQALRMAASLGIRGSLRFRVLDILDRRAIPTGTMILETQLGAKARVEGVVTDGAVEFTNLPGGMYTATLTAPGYEPRNGTLTFLTVDQRELNKTTFLSPLIQLIIAVTDSATGKPVAGAQALVVVEDGGKEAARQQAASDSRGRAVFAPLPGGGCQIYIEKTGYASGSGYLVFRTGDLRRAFYQIALTPAATVQLCALNLRAINSQTRAAVARFDAAIRPATPGTKTLQQTSQSGTVDFSNLPPGTYLYSLRADGFQPDNGAFELASGQARQTVLVALTPVATPPVADAKPRTPVDKLRPRDTDTVRRPPENPVRPPPIANTPKTEPKKDPPKRDFAAMAGQLNAIYAAAMQRRFAKWGEPNLYKVEFRKPWAWNAGTSRFEADIVIWQTGPAKNNDPKTFKPAIISEMVGGNITAFQADSNIATGKWFGE